MRKAWVILAILATSSCKAYGAINSFTGASSTGISASGSNSFTGTSVDPITTAGSTQTKRGGLAIGGNLNLGISTGTKRLNVFGDADIFGALRSGNFFVYGHVQVLGGSMTVSQSIVTGSSVIARSVDVSSISLRGVRYNPPPADGTSGQTLQTNGSGGLSWGSAVAGAGSGFLATFGNGTSKVVTSSMDFITTGLLTAVWQGSSVTLDVPRITSSGTIPGSFVLQGVGVIRATQTAVAGDTWAWVAPHNFFFPTTFYGQINITSNTIIRSTFSSTDKLNPTPLLLISSTFTNTIAHLLEVRAQDANSGITLFEAIDGTGTAFIVKGAANFTQNRIGIGTPNPTSKFDCMDCSGTFRGQGAGLAVSGVNFHFHNSTVDARIEALSASTNSLSNILNSTAAVTAPWTFISSTTFIIGSTIALGGANIIVPSSAAPVGDQILHRVGMSSQTYWGGDNAGGSGSGGGGGGVAVATSAIQFFNSASTVVFLGDLVSSAAYFTGGASIYFRLDKSVIFNNFASTTSAAVDALHLDTGTLQAAILGYRSIFSTNAVTNAAADTPHPFIISTNTLQAGTTVYVASMTVLNTIIASNTYVMNESTVAGILHLPNGSSGAPSLQFWPATGGGNQHGFYGGNNLVNIAFGGTVNTTWSAATVSLGSTIQVQGKTGTAASPPYSFGSCSNCGFFLDGAPSYSVGISANSQHIQSWWGTGQTVIGRWMSGVGASTVDSPPAILTLTTSTIKNVPLFMATTGPIAAYVKLVEITGSSTSIKTSTFCIGSSCFIYFSTPGPTTGDYIFHVNTDSGTVFLGRDGGGGSGTTIVSGASALAITSGSISGGNYLTTVSSPSNFLIFSSSGFEVSPLGGLGTTSFITINYSSVTAQGFIDTTTIKNLFYAFASTSDARGNTFINFRSTTDAALNSTGTAAVAAFASTLSTFSAFQITRSTGDAQILALHLDTGTLQANAWVAINSTYAAFQVTRATGDAQIQSLHLDSGTLATNTFNVWLTTNPYEMISLPANSWYGCGPSSASWENAGFSMNITTSGFNAFGDAFHKFRDPSISSSAVCTSFRMPYTWAGDSIAFQTSWQASTGESSTNMFWSMGAVALSSGTDAYSLITTTTSVFSTFVSSNAETWTNPSAGFIPAGTARPGSRVKLKLFASGGNFRGFPLMTETAILYRRAFYDGRPR